MTFAPIETSREDGNVLELYTFTFGPEVFRLTSFNSDIFFAGVQWFSTQISRSGLQNSVENTVNEIQIVMPLDDPIPQRYIRNVPGQVGNVLIQRAHADDPAEDTVLEFDGFIAQVRFDGTLQAEITCNPQTNIFKRGGPRFTYQGLCNNVLFDSGCKVVRGSFTHTGLVSGVSGNQITVSGLSAQGVDWAVGGFVTTPAGGNDDSRLVLFQSGDTVTLLLPFATVVLATTVDVFAGCDHSLTTCNTKFANEINYGGFAFVPTKNPFNSTLRGGD